MIKKALIIFATSIMSSTFIWTPVQAEETLEIAPASYEFEAPTLKDEECFLEIQRDNSCCKCSRWWVDLEYLFWQLGPSPKLIPLVTSASSLGLGPSFGPNLADTDSPFATPGGAEIVLGDKRIHHNWTSGAKFAVGSWLNNNQDLGLELSYFFIPRDTKSKSVSSSGLPGSPYLGVPFYDVLIHDEDAVALSNSNPFSEGGINVFAGSAKYTSRTFMQGVEVNLLKLRPTTTAFNITFLTGFRFWNFDQTFKFKTSSPYLAVPASISRTLDKFTTQNFFYGGQIGIGLDFNYNGFFVDVKGKIAFGANRGRIHIEGRYEDNNLIFEPMISRSYLAPGIDRRRENIIPEFGSNNLQTYNIGIFALPSNIGTYRKTFFCLIPEANIDIGYQYSDRLRFKLGYTFIYVSKALWASHQIDRVLNTLQSPAIEYSSRIFLVLEPRPRPFHKTSSLWIQGATAGLDLSF